MDGYTSSDGTSSFYSTGVGGFIGEMNAANVTAGNNNAQITSGALNPFGSQADFGAQAALDAEGAATMGGVNTPPVSDRTGLPSGKGTAASDMSSTQLNANIGQGSPPLRGLLGKPDDNQDEDDDC